jgi:electron transfer flavoprotein beta subunit
VVKEINEPRLPSLKGMLRAKQAKITVWSQKELNLDSQSIGLCGSPTQVIKIFTPSPRAGGQIFTGDTQEMVEKLVGLLKNEIT